MPPQAAKAQMCGLSEHFDSATPRVSEYTCPGRSAWAWKRLACMSHHPTVEARDTTAMTSLRLLVVLNVLFKYACARQAARASP